MNIIDKITSLFSGGSKRVTSFFRPLRTRSIDQDPYGAFAGWASRAVIVKAQRVAASSPVLYRVRRGDGKNVEVVDDHQLIALLRKPNPYMTGYDMRFLMSCYLDIWGAAPLEIVRNGQSIGGLNLLRPDLVKFEVVNSILVGYTVRENGVERTIPRADVIYIRIPNPENPLQGFSAMKAAGLEIDVDASMALWNKAYMENGAEPSSVLTTDDRLEEDQFNELTAAWAARFAGPGNAGKTAILESGLKFTPTSSTPKELDYIEGRRFNRDSILTLLGVPKALLIADDVNRANAEAAERVIAINEIEPRLKMIDEKLNEELIPLFDSQLWLDHSSVVPADRDQARSDLAAGTTAGALTLNEKRAYLNLPAVEGGDEIEETPGQMLTLSRSNVTESKSMEICQRVMARTYGQRKAIEILKQSSARLYVRKGVIQARLETKSAQSDNDGFDFESKAWKNFEEKFPGHAIERKAYLKRSKSVAKKFASVQKEIFNAERDAVMRIIGNTEVKAPGKKKLADVAKQVINLMADDEELNKFMGEAASRIDDLLVTEILNGSTGVMAVIRGKLENGKYTDPVLAEDSPQVLQFLKDKEVRLQGVRETTVSQVQDAITSWVDNEDNMKTFDDLKSGINDVFDNAEAYRAETIARTELGSAQNFGRSQEMVEQGIEKQMWISAGDALVREEHIDVKDVNVGSSFDVGDESLEYPGDPHGSPENIINCRCTIGAVVNVD